jgi:hypothetical protein
MNNNQHLELQKKLENIGFKMTDDYEDSEIGYTVFSFKGIEITFESNSWYLELQNGKEAVKALGVTSFEAIQSFKNLIYGN